MNCFFGCEEKKSEKSKDLVSFNSKFIAEIDEENYNKYEAELNSEFEPKYIGNTIEITKIINANACGEYDGNIDIRKDSLILIYKLVSNEVCTSRAVVEVRYKIKNEKRLKYKVGLHYE
ncbi:hypothetical protein [Flavobacterium chungangense]|uniref:hypothetical protein n=1 Tax=Flavobacterium chungangense TaxID=554283 RepID=UPI0004DF1010|nr:hypothetical protein [Flavobacterium chungangense]